MGYFSLAPVAFESDGWAQEGSGALPEDFLMRKEVEN